MKDYYVILQVSRSVSVVGENGGGLAYVLMIVGCSGSAERTCFTYTRTRTHNIPPIQQSKQTGPRPWRTSRRPTRPSR